MLTDTALHPPASREVRAERSDRPAGFLDRIWTTAKGMALAPLSGPLLNLHDFVDRVLDAGSQLRTISDSAIRTKATEARLRLHREGIRRDATAQAFALVREVSGRVHGMRHFESQIMGGFVLLQGMIAEMETGEGKTLTATLPASTAALAGIPVHVVTVNDYLAARDAELMGPVYRMLGLTTGLVIHGLSPAERQTAYDCDIAYCTNKELAFDYLKDILTLGDLSDSLRMKAETLYSARARTKGVIMRGLHFAIIDEADSLLIDESKTPLIISGQSDRKDERRFLEEALELADALAEGVDYGIDLTKRQVLLTGKGEEDLARRTAELGPLWCSPTRRKEMISLALSARRLFHRDEHYIVQEGKVQIVDEYTGRVMEDRSWEQGLHQLIEVKEGCEVTGQREPLARISYQRFFRRYLHLSGMTGTAREVRRELLSVYDIKTLRIPTHRPVIRRILPDRIFTRRSEKWRAVVERVRMHHEAGRPVLIGTRSVAASEELSRFLSEAGLDHQVLNAKNDKEEAAIVSKAGESGRITVATNMAGRGTDIKPDAASLEKGGLHVILTERHDAGRIDRQLAGRCGRQGDPGSFEAFLSLEDSLLESASGSFLLRLFKKGSPLPLSLWHFGARVVILRAQKKMERLHAGMRKDLFRQDMKMKEILSFAGRSE